MEYVTLSNGVKMPILGYGVYQECGFDGGARKRMIGSYQKRAIR